MVGMKDTFFLGAMARILRGLLLEEREEEGEREEV